MKFDVITVFPEIFKAAQVGVLGQAIKDGKVFISTITPREFTSDIHKTVDDRPFGGGDGMVMLYEPLKASIQKSLASGSKKVIYLSPQGAILSPQKAKELVSEEHVTLICGRYGGIDQRIINDCVDEEISIGDYVLSGGDFAALVVADVVSRFVPGVLGNKDSCQQDSFENGLLEAPLFTRPSRIKRNSSEVIQASEPLDLDLQLQKELGEFVPEILLSGHHKNIQSWKENMSLLVTLQKRKEVFKKFFNQKDPKIQKNIRKDLKNFWQGLSENDKKACGISLTDTDFDF